MRTNARPSLNDREQNLSRSLDLAQHRVSQLLAEIEANREAQAIVLETKESVMRSLARQNSQLIIEARTACIHGIRALYVTRLDMCRGTA